MSKSHVSSRGAPQYETKLESRREIFGRYQNRKFIMIFVYRSNTDARTQHQLYHYHQSDYQGCQAHYQIRCSPSRLIFQIIHKKKNKTNLLQYSNNLTDFIVFNFMIQTCGDFELKSRNKWNKFIFESKDFITVHFIILYIYICISLRSYIYIMYRYNTN